jgi:ParB family chromosome partitioning protein
MLTGTDDEARMWEIAENLHRADLTVLERDEHIAEWVRLAGKNDDPKPGQVGPVSNVGGRGKEGGISAAARELGIAGTTAKRATKVAAITPEAKAAAKETGLDNNQAALIQVAKAPPEEQAAKVEEIAAAKKAAADDENLCGSNLSAAERALFTRRRKDAYEALHPETAHGGDRKSSGQVGHLNADRFTIDASEKTGQSERTVRRDAERGESIPEPILQQIAGDRVGARLIPTDAVT